MSAATDSDTETVLVPLLDEGVAVWRPVAAIPLGGDSYRLEGRNEEDEVWAFAPGSIVRARRKTIDGREALVAEATVQKAAS
jgi:hypothetical protein